MKKSQVWCVLVLNGERSGIILFVGDGGPYNRVLKQTNSSSVEKLGGSSLSKTSRA